MTWLIVGGAGYIGSHIVEAWNKQQLPHVILDNLSTGKLTSIPQESIFIRGDASDSKLISNIIHDYKISGVIHLAAFKNARESIDNPSKYWDNNISATLGLLQALKDSSVKSLILSSSCSVYGSAAKVTNNSLINPLSPYARTKVTSEWMIEDFCKFKNINWANLRYFNVIGNSNFSLAIDRDQKSLIPSITLNIKRKIKPKIYGNKFETIDGTAVRDFIDVRDLTNAHYLISMDLEKNEYSIIRGHNINVSTGYPKSVLEVTKIIIKELNWNQGIEFLPSLNGEASAIWAKPDKKLTKLKWRSDYTIEESIKSFINHPDINLFIDSN